MLPYFSTLRATLYVILACLFLTPSLAMIPGVPTIRPEELVIMAFLGFVALASLAGVPIRVAWGLRQTLLLAFFFFILFSISVGMLLGYGGGLGDLNQLIRMIKYLVIYTICVTVICHSADPQAESQRVLRYTLWLTLPLFLITVQQYFDIGGLNELYVSAINPVHDKALLGLRRWLRPIGMIGNPNELGFLFALGAVIATYLLTRGFRLRYLLLCGMNLVGILMTASRTSLVVALGGMVFLAVGHVASRRSLRVSSAIQGLVVLVLVAGIGAAAFSGTRLEERLLGRFEELADPTAATSWQGRLERWDINLELFQASPWFGVGPLRRVEMPAGDNEWLLLLRSYGIIGTLALVLAFVVPYWRSARTDTRLLAAGVLLVTAVYMIPAAVFHSLALMPVVLILLALSDTTPRRRILR